MGGNGLGPITAISPRMMLMSSGNSSNEHDRSHRPKEVKRSSSGSKFPSLSLALVIVRNLRILNVLPPKPLLSCLKKIGEPNLSRTIIHKTRNKGLMTRNRQSAEIRSKPLLKKQYILELFCINDRAEILQIISVVSLVNRDRYHVA